MDEDRHYPSENILVHEFAHTVMAVGMNEDQRQAVISAYFNARSSQLYKPSIYMMANADEYWAEGAQAWFEATVRVGKQIWHVHPSQGMPLIRLINERSCDSSQDRALAHSAL